MIFLLTNTVTGDIIYLSDQQEYKIGRKNCDILLENDQSISREHAKLRVKPDHVTLEDCKSKYKTLHKGIEVKPKVEIRLNHMDLVQFGIFNSKFRFESYNFIVAASALPSDKKATLRQSLDSCSGKYVDKWSDKCTHLTVDNLTLTIKVLQALVDEKPIVTVDYWLDYARSIERETSAPDVNKYKPPIGEQLLRSDFEYKNDPRRKTLFNNKMFVFLTTGTQKQMRDIINSCGGNSISWEENPKTLSEIKRSPLEHLLIKTDNQEQNVSFEAVIKDLAKDKKRPIPINEIALAIVNCSCDGNCNPSFNKVSEVFGGTVQKPQAKDVLAIETQSETMFPSTSGIKTEHFIPPTVEDDFMALVEDRGGNKRPIEDEVENMASKRAKPEQENQTAKVTTVGKEQKKNDTAGASDWFKTKPQLSQKRKAAQEASNSSSSPLKPNPFSLIKPPLNKKSKSNEEENPFELTKASRPTKPSHSKTNQNPFANILNVSNRATSPVKVEKNFPKGDEPRKQIKLIPQKRSDDSLVSPSKKSFLNVTWISKSSIKQEIKEEDPEIAKISEAFKGCVRVEVLPVYERPTLNVSRTSFDSTDGRKNFKIFKKVQPLKPQTTIISRHEFKIIAPGDVTGIMVNDIDSDEEDGPPETRIKETIKPRGKRFVL